MSGPLISREIRGLYFARISRTGRWQRLVACLHEGERKGESYEKTDQNNRGEVKSRLYVFLVAVAVLTGLLMLITFAYEDVISLTAWSFNFWDLFFSGRLNEFYVYTGQNIRGAVHENCGGNYLWLLPLCVWNLPLWAVHCISGTIQAANFFSICWTKLFLFLLQGVTVYVSGKICAMLTPDREKTVMAMLLIMASPEILLSVGYTGQDEIVYVSLFVLCLYCFMKEYWKRCYLLMVCCVTFCPIMLLPVLAVLLIREKRIVRILLYALGTMLPLLVFEALYRNDLVYQTVKHTNDFGRFVQTMLQGSMMDTNWGEFSVAGIILCGIYFYCYFEHFPQEKDEYHKTVIYIVTLVFAVVSFVMIQDYYRMFLYVPFLVMVMMTSGQNTGVNLTLFTGMTYGRTFQAIGNNYPRDMNSIYIMKHSWITALCDYVGNDKYLDSIENSVCLWSYAIRLGGMLDVICLIVETCVMGAIIILLVINRIHDTKRYETRMGQGILLILYTFCMPIVLMCYYYMILH